MQAAMCSRRQLQHVLVEVTSSIFVLSISLKYLLRFDSEAWFYYTDCCHGNARATVVLTVVTVDFDWLELARSERPAQLLTIETFVPCNI